MAELKSTNYPHTVGRALVPPYRVYLDNKEVGVYQCDKKAEAHYQRLRRSVMTASEVRNERDRIRHVLQTPIATPRYCVMYLKNGKEHRSAWLYREEHAQQGLAMMQDKYGKRNAIIYVD